MRVLIAGAGRHGTQIARVLSATRNDVTLVDHDDNRVAELEGLSHVRLLAGDACDTGVLERAGALTSDLVIAATGRAEDNLVISLRRGHSRLGQCLLSNLVVHADEVRRAGTTTTSPRDQKPPSKGTAAKGFWSHSSPDFPRSRAGWRHRSRTRDSRATNWRRWAAVSGASNSLWISSITLSSSSSASSPCGVIVTMFRRL